MVSSLIEIVRTVIILYEAAWPPLTPQLSMGRAPHSQNKISHNTNYLPHSRFFCIQPADSSQTPLLNQGRAMKTKQKTAASREKSQHASQTPRFRFGAFRRNPALNLPVLYLRLKRSIIWARGVNLVLIAPLAVALARFPDLSWFRQVNSAHIIALQSSGSLAR